MKITDEIEFSEGLPLSEQSVEFQEWYYKNIRSKITDKTVPDSMDEYDRPVSFSIEFGDFIVTTAWIYIYATKSNWACSKHEISIKTK